MEHVDAAHAGNDIDSIEVTDSFAHRGNLFRDSFSSNTF